MCIFKAALCEDLHLFSKIAHLCLFMYFICLSFNYIFFKTKGCIIIGATWLLQRERKIMHLFSFLFYSWSCTFYTEFRTVYIQMYSYNSSDVWCEMHARSYLLICSRGKHILLYLTFHCFVLSSFAYLWGYLWCLILNAVIGYSL